MSLIKRRNRFLPTSNTWMEDFFNDDFNFMHNVESGMNVPPVNIEETDDSFTLELAAPGMKKEDFDIEVKDNSLIISKETRESSEEKNDNFTRKEFNYQAFRRSFWLPENVDESKIKATYENGMLSVVLTKNKNVPANLSKKIEVV